MVIVVASGKVAPLDDLPKSVFRDLFIAEGRFERYDQGGFTVMSIRDPWLGLIGAAAASAREDRMTVPWTMRPALGAVIPVLGLQEETELAGACRKPFVGAGPLVPEADPSNVRSRSNANPGDGELVPVIVGAVAGKKKKKSVRAR